MSKGKATRSSTATSSTPAPAPTISNDILTGRFTEHEWNTLVEVEDGEELVYDLVDTVVQGVLNVIHDRHLENNVIPFSLDWAENIMVKLIDWQFLTHDSGESKKEVANWLPDEEPARVPLDSWGRGSVPSRVVEVVKEEELEQDASHVIQAHSAQHESSGDEASDREDLDKIRSNPDLHKLNKLREQLKYYKISSDDIATLEKIDKPSDTLHLLYQALGVSQGQPEVAYEYDVAIANIGQTKNFIENFGPQPINEATLAGLKTYIDNIKLHPDHVSQLVSPAALGFCTWLHTAYTYQTLCNVLNVETSIDFRTLKHCVVEMKSLSKPPQGVIHVMCATVTLLDGKFIRDLQVAVKVFANPEKLLEKLENFDCKKLTQKFIQKYKKEFMTTTTDEVKRLSMGCGYLYQWCEDQIYGSGSVIVRPPEVKQKRTRRRLVKIIKPTASEEMGDNDQVAGSYTGSLDNMLPHQSAAIVKAQQGRPPGQKEVEYDDKGNVVSVMKITKLPTHRVKTTYEIIESTSSNNKKLFSKKLKPLKGVPPKARAGAGAGYFPFETQDHTPSPPSFVDAVTASPGVVIKQGTRVKRGPESVILSPIEQTNIARFQNLLSSSS